MKRTKQQLLERQREIEIQLGRVSRDERLELDNDLEEQAIQTEHQEVSITMADNLMRELRDIEERLLDFEEM
jgi:RNA polymerase-binding transcription factor DksA